MKTLQKQRAEFTNFLSNEICEITKCGKNSLVIGVVSISKDNNNGWGVKAPRVSDLEQWTRFVVGAVPTDLHYGYKKMGQGHEMFFASLKEAKKFAIFYQKFCRVFSER